MTYKGAEIHLMGQPICPGIAIGKPFHFTVVDENVPEFNVPKTQIDQEVARFYKALGTSRKELLSLEDRLQTEGGNEAAAILRSHIEITHDPLMTKQVEQEIRAKRKNTEAVFKTVIGEVEEKFNKISDHFFRDRLKDFQDISRRIIGHLRKSERYSLADIECHVIVFADELSPSDTAEAKTHCIDAFVTRSGSETSHVAIMARAKGIPFVSSVDFPDLLVARPPQVIVDGDTGKVIINPSAETLAFYETERKKRATLTDGFKEKTHQPAVTKDGHTIHLSANVEMFDQLETLHDYGGEGVGLFRSEYLFLANESFPSEQEQFAVYRSVVEKVKGHAAVIRTFDIGGDKFGEFHPSRYEQNPYLGCRAIRLMLKEREPFKRQIRAILRASAFGKVKILFPMISGVEELRAVKEVLEEVKGELAIEGIAFDANIPIGCMVEVPSAALIADLLAAECNFLSLGTNDLVQYVLAVDRGNPAMSYLYTPSHPGVLRLLKSVIDAAKEAGKPVSICGEIAADPKYTPLLLGLGFDELSVASPCLPAVKDRICSLSKEEAQALAQHLLTLKTTDEIENALAR